MRAFVALWLDLEVGAEVERRTREKLDRAGWRIYAAGDLHLTLVFLGEVLRERLAVLEAALDSALEGAGAPRLRLTRTGAFPGRGRERVLWIGIEEHAGERLAGLERCVRRACGETGLELEARPWAPHLTVARPARGGGHMARVPDEFYALDLGLEWKPRVVSLVESLAGRVTPGESKYATLTQWTLRDEPRGVEPGRRAR